MKQRVILAHAQAASQLDKNFREVLTESSLERADKAAAKIMTSPDKADQNLTANSLQPNKSSDRASSHHVPIVEPAVNSLPILGTK